MSRIVGAGRTCLGSAGTNACHRQQNYCDGRVAMDAVWMFILAHWDGGLLSLNQEVCCQGKSNTGARGRCAVAEK